MPGLDCCLIAWNQSNLHAGPVPADSRRVFAVRTASYIDGLVLRARDPSIAGNRSRLPLPVAQAFGANVPESLIAAYDLFDKFFGTASKISADRACHICRTLSTEATLELSPCRACRTPYLIANAAPRIELSHTFSCPGCSGTLGGPHAAARKRKK